jgi:tellurite resistance protein
MLHDPDTITLRGIGLLFLACSHAVDNDLAESERDLIVHKIEGRLVDATQKQVYAAVRDAVAVYKGQAGTAEVAARVHEAATGLAGVMARPDLAQLLADLVEVAQVDGAVSSPEREFISDVAGTFGLDTPAL